MKIDLSGLSFGDDGRTVLGNDQLRQLEAGIDVTAGGTGTTNADDCSGTTNSRCTNNLRCNDSTNNISCTNTFLRCKGSKNPAQQER